MKEYIFRAICSIKDDNEQKRKGWVEGSLNSIRVAMSPFDPPANKYHYQIITEAPNSFADWSLPYPQKSYTVVDEASIGIWIFKYDIEGTKIFEKDIIRIFSTSNPCVFFDYLITDVFTAIPYVNYTDKDGVRQFTLDYSDFLDCSTDLQGAIVVGNLINGYKPGLEPWNQTEK